MEIVEEVRKLAEDHWDWIYKLELRQQLARKALEMVFKKKAVLLRNRGEQVSVSELVNSIDMNKFMVHGWHKQEVEAIARAVVETSI